MSEMDEATLKRAYDRFFAMSKEDHAKLDAVADAVSEYLAREWKAGGSQGGFIAPNRVCALLAIEAAEAWQIAEAKRP